jgi:hypothetical protein
LVDIVELQLVEANFLRTCRLPLLEALNDEDSKARRKGFFGSLTVTDSAMKKDLDLIEGSKVATMLA